MSSLWGQSAHNKASFRLRFQTDRFNATLTVDWPSESCHFPGIRYINIFILINVSLFFYFLPLPLFPFLSFFYTPIIRVLPIAATTTATVHSICDSMHCVYVVARKIAQSHYVFFLRSNRLLNYWSLWTACSSCNNFYKVWHLNFVMLLYAEVSRQFSTLCTTTIEQLKNGLIVVLMYIHSLWKAAWLSEAFAEECTVGIIVKIPKKGNLKICDNWRGTCVLTAISKIISKVLLDRIKDHLYSTIDPG